MTTLPEAALAREAEMAYAVMNHVTDYDCWHESEACPLFLDSDRPSYQTADFLPNPFARLDLDRRSSFPIDGTFWPVAEAPSLRLTAC